MSTFVDGDLVLLIDAKDRRRMITLSSGKQYFTHHGAIDHDVLIGSEQGRIVRTPNGTPYLALKPLLRDFVLSMPRGAAVIYPKDASLIIGYADLYPGARVLEAGVGSGALSASILRAVGTTGSLVSYERRADFAEIAQSNVQKFLGFQPQNWQVHVDDLLANDQSGFTHVFLDMLEPWLVLDIASKAMTGGGVLMAYVATTTQLSSMVEAIRESGNFTEPEPLELILRNWHSEGLAVRPVHRMIGHTGFLIFARRMALGEAPLVKRRRPTTSGKLLQEADLEQK